MSKMIFGRYLPGDSIIHRLDPRLKLVAAFYFIGIIFLCNNFLSYALMFIFVLACVALSKVKWHFFFEGLKPLLWLIIFTVGLQILFSQGQHVYFHWGVITISREGIINGLFIFCRFVLIIFMSTLLTLTTSPLSLADATESLLKPLEKFHFPAHEVALMLSIALRFVPTLMDEAEKIMNAQRARGVDFNSGNLLQRVKAIIPILIPLFVSSFSKAEDLADAMEARGYHGGEGRTKYRKLSWHSTDTTAIIVFVILTIILILVRA